jgi:hypothetical protein
MFDLDRLGSRSGRIAGKPEVGQKRGSRRSLTMIDVDICGSAGIGNDSWADHCYGFISTFRSEAPRTWPGPVS